MYRHPQPPNCLLKAIFLALFLSSFSASATQVVIVDTDASQQPDYTSLSAAVLAYQGTLTEPLKIIARASSGVVDTQPVSVENYVTTASADLTIELEQGYTLYLTAPSNHSTAIALNTDFVTLRGTGGRILVDSNGFDSAKAVASSGQTAAAIVTVENLLLEQVGNKQTGAIGLYMESELSSHVIRNNVIRGFGDYGVLSYYKTYLYNNTLTHNYIGVGLSSFTGEAYNNLSVNNIGADYYQWLYWNNGQTGNNVSSDHTSPNEEGDYQRAKFLDYLAPDYALSTDDLAGLDKGADLSAATHPFNYDFDGDLRTGTWDVGAYEVDPATYDQDSDGMSDRWERLYGLNTSSDDGSLDPDLDGLSNLQEFIASASPLLADSDLDGTNDAQELDNATSPFINNVTRIVTVDTDPNQNADYLSLSEAIQDQKGVLTQPLVIHASASSGLVDVQAVLVDDLITGFETSLTIEFEAGYALSVSAEGNYQSTLNIESDFVTLTGKGGKLQVDSNGYTGTKAINVGGQRLDAVVTIENLFLEQVGNSDQGAVGINTDSPLAAHVIRNNVIFGFGDYGVFSAHKTYLYNNTLTHNNNGVGLSNFTGEAYNNLSVHNLTSDYYRWLYWDNGLTGNNVSSDSTSPNDDGDYKSPRFLDYLAPYYAIRNDDTSALDKGRDLSSALFPFNYDIEGVARTGAWDVGAYGADLSTYDQDNDGMSDRWERLYGLDTTLDDSALDPDSDGLTNLQEYQTGASPFLVDSEGDGFDDSTELVNGTSPYINNRPRIVIVDTDENQNPDYTNLAAAIAGEVGILTQPLTIVARASSGIADTQPVDLVGIQTGSELDVTIVMTEGYVLDVTAIGNYQNAITNDLDYVNIVGEGGKIQLHGNGYNGHFGIYSGPSGPDGKVFIEGLHIEGDLTGLNDAYGIKSFSSTVVHVIRNNVVEGFAGAGDSKGLRLYYENYVYNNTLAGNDIGVSLNSTTGELINNLSVDSVSADYQIYTDLVNTTVGTNISSDSSSPNVNLRDTVIQFVNVAASDYRLGEVNPVAIDQGANLSQGRYPFSGDHAGELRQGAWDIGAFEYSDGTVVNQSPMITSDPILGVNEGELYAYIVDATDPEGGPLSYQVSGAPAGLSIDTATGELSWQTDYESFGSYALTITVADSEGLSATQTYTLDVVNVNRPPAIDSSPVLSAIEGQAYDYTVSANDPDGDTITFALINAPAGMTIDSTNGAITWSPSYDSSGNYAVEIQASDPEGITDTQAYSLAVSDVNRSPSANDLAYTLDEDTSQQITMTGSDPDSDALTFNVTSQPINGSLIIAGDNVSYQPNANFYGADSFEYAADDGLNTSTVANVTLSVQPVNDSPVITSTAVTAGEEEELYTYQMMAIDSDGDELTFQLINAPQNAFLDVNAGLLTWIPAVGDAGSHPIALRVSDGEAQVTQGFTVVISSVNRAPVAQSQTITVMEGTTNDITLLGSDIDGDSLDYLVVEPPKYGSLTGTAPNLSYQPEANFNGVDGFSFKVNDGAIDSAPAFVTIKTNNLLNDAAPKILSSPGLSALINEEYEYQLLTSGSGALSVALQSAPDGMIIDAGNLITWSPTEQQVASHSVVVTVTDLLGRTDIQTFNIDVSNELVVTSDPVKKTRVNLPYSYQFEVAGGAPPYTSPSLVGPDGMDISESGLVTWLPGDTDESDHPITITQTDSEGQSVSQSYILGVYQESVQPSFAGTDFRFMFPQVSRPVYVYISTAGATSGYVDVPGTDYMQNFSSAGSEVIEVAIPYYYLVASNGVIESDVSVHLVADRNVTVSASKVAGFTTDAFSVLPTKSLGNDYFVMSYELTGGSEYGFVATEDNTSVTLTMADDVDLPNLGLGRVHKGEKVDLVLNEGDVFVNRGDDEVATDFTGTRIQSDKPIAAFGGNVCAYIPYDYGYCDHVVEQLIPVDSWGDRYLSMPFKTRNGDTFRILAAEDNTYISINDSVSFKLDKGEFVERVLRGPQDIRGSKPISVAQFSNGHNYDSGSVQNYWEANPHETIPLEETRRFSDPFMLIVPPSDQYLDYYQVASLEGSFRTNYLNIIAPKGAEHTVVVDGQTILASEFVDIGGSGYVGTQLTVTGATHIISADEPIGVVVYGYDISDSYGYIGGMGLTAGSSVNSLNVLLSEDHVRAGEQSCTKVEVLDEVGAPLFRARVKFEVQGVTSTSDIVFTDELGEATFCYSSSSEGSDSLTVRAGSQIAVRDISWFNADPNQSHTPTISSYPTLYTEPSDVYRYQVLAADADGDDLLFSLVNAPVGMTVDLSGGITWNEPVASNNTYDYVIEVSDGNGNVAEQRVSLTVNRPPRVSVPPPSYVMVGERYNERFEAVDDDGDSVWMKLIEYPAGPKAMRLGSRHHGLYWANAYSSPQIVPITIELTDGRGGMSEYSFELDILANNSSPIITSEPPLDAWFGQKWEYTVEAIDADENELTYVLSSNPIGMTINGSTLTWTPNSSQYRRSDIQINVTDGFGGSTRQSFSIYATAPPSTNDFPEVNSTPVFEAVQGIAYQYKVDASDSGNDPLIYDLGVAPDGMSISFDGLISWVPTSNQVGIHDVEVRVNDGELWVVQGYSIVVTDSVVALDVDVVVSPPVVSANEDVTVDVYVAGGLGSKAISLTIDGIPTTLDASNSVIVSSSETGRHDIRVSVTDESGSDSINTYFTVSDPSDLDLPVAEIISPDHHDLITGLFQITGTASDTNLLEYRVLLSEKGQQNWRAIGGGSANVINSDLALLDSTSITNGLYDLVLDVVDINGQRQTDTLTLRIDSDLKVGNFSFTVEDVNIPMMGLPIRVTRTYDTRRKHEDLDFGFGWSVGYQDVKVEESRTPGEAWALNEYSAGPLGILSNYCVEPLGSPLVLVTLPTGDVEQFEVQASPRCNAYSPLLNVQLSFKPVGDTQSTLGLQGDSPLLRLANSYLEILGDGQAYDPDQYELTTQSGYIYYLDQNFGVTRIEGPNGHTLTYNDSGIHHSAGKSIFFSRDSEGRIEGVTDPAGNSYAYSFDGQGNLVEFEDSLSNITEYDYNTTHGLTEIRDPLGRSIVRNIYDDDGRLEAQEDSDGNRTEFNHDIAGRQSIVTDRRNNLTVYYYDDEGNVTSEVNALNEVTTYTYDENGNQLSKTNDLGQTESASYDDRNNQLTQTDALGNTVAFTYNPRGQELTIEDARGNVYENSYDSVGNLLTVMDPLGNIAGNNINAQGLVTLTRDVAGNETTYTYDTDGNKLTETDAEANVMSYSYDDIGNVLSEARTRTLADGSVTTETTTYEYDNLNRLLKTIYPDLTESTMEYDAVGNQVASIDQQGYRTEYDYDAYGRLLTTRYHDGTTSVSTYDEEGNKLTDTDRNGLIMRYTYDGLNRLTRTTYPDLSYSETVYDAAGRVSAEIDANGNRSEYSYDAAGRRTAVQDALNQVHTFNYDADGNLIEETDARNNTITYTINELDQKTQTTFMDNTFIQEGFDLLGRRTSQTDQASKVTAYTYDGLGRLTTVTDALLHDTTFTYDEAGNKLTQTDAENRTTTWSYDSLGRVVSRTLPEGQVESFTYDDAGNMASHTDFNNQLTTFTYDSNHQVTRIDYYDASFETFTYDDAGNRKTAINSEGTTSYDYDSRNRLVKQTQANGTILDYEYDNVGNKTKLTTTIGLDVSEETYTYDALNRLATVTDANSGLTTYGYDEVGNRTSISYPNGTSITYVYDNLNRLTQVNHYNSSGAMTQQFDYTLHDTGRREQIDELSGRSTAYTYDDLYRLTDEVITDAVNGNYNANYQFDNVGNRTYSTVDGASKTYVYDDNDRLQTAGSVLYTYDDNGNTLTETDGSTTTTHTYDAKNKLVAVEKDVSGIITNSSYSYNVDGIRTGKVVEGVVTKYIVDANRDYAQVILELDSDDNPLVQYTYGDDLISQDRNGTQSYFHYDGLGSTRALSDATGNVTDTYNYEAFGELLNSSGSTENKYQFAGEQWDQFLGQQYLRARYYDSSIGRFSSMDTWMGRDQDPITLNKYVYGNSDPVMYTDPSGHMSMLSLNAGFSIQGVLATTAVASAGMSGYSIGTGGVAIYEGRYADGAMDIALGFMGIGVPAVGIQGVKFVFGATNKSIRQKYKQFATQDIPKKIAQMKKRGDSSKRIAEMALIMRNSIKQEARDMMKADGLMGKAIVKILELRNLAKYKNKLGPDMKYYLGRGKSSDDIIEGAMRSNDAVNRMMGGVH